MKVIYFIGINIVAIISMCGAYMYTFINDIDHSNAIYFWIMAYTCVIGCSIVGMNCRNQVLRLEELMQVKLTLEPTDEEAAELLKMEDEQVVI